MHNESKGINLIIADSREEVDVICKILGVSEPSMLKSLDLLYNMDNETVFFVVMSRKDQMTELASVLKLKRCVISHSGMREASGFNLDWLKKMVGHKTVKPVVECQPVRPISFSQEFEKEDPYVALGYSR
ncbi:hypothetical protein D9M68_18630 [compost metagenome]